jgi:hypothetical protein
MAVTNLPYSFIQFTDCNASDGGCYDDAFALSFKAGDTYIMQILSESDMKLDVLNASGSIVASNVASFDLLESGVYRAEITIPNLPKGCYRFQLSVGGSVLCGLANICSVSNVCTLGLTYTVDSCSQKFNIITDTCFTEVVAYKNDFNEVFAGFKYLSDFQNQIRLPIEISYPQTDTKREVYKRSDGVIVSLGASADKVFKLKTAHANEHFHDCIAIALLHDNFRITEGKRLGNYFLDDGYEVGWFEGINGSKLAKGEAKVKKSPYDVLNPKY